MPSRFEVIPGGLTGNEELDYEQGLRRSLGPLADKQIWNVSSPWFRDYFKIPADSALWRCGHEDDLARGRVMARFELSFSQVPDRLRLEAMAYFAIRIADPRRRTSDWFERSKNLLRWLASFDVDYRGPRLCDFSAEDLRDKFEAFLQANGTARKPLRQKYMRQGQVIIKEYRDPSSMPANDMAYVLRLFRESLKPLYERDWILAEDLGFSEVAPRARADNLINLDDLTTDWYRAAARRYLITKSMDRQFAWASIGRILASVLEPFHEFLVEKFGSPRPEQITKRVVTEGFKSWGIHQRKYAGYQWFSDVCVFLHFCMDQELPGLPKFIVTPDHFPRKRKSTREYMAEAPERAISPEVLAAIIDHINELPAWMRRIFILGRYTAYRRTDLHSCPYHLLQPDDGTFMQLIRYHSKTDTTTRQLIKIDDDIGKLIIKTVTDQQMEVKDTFGYEPKYLFASPRSGDATPTHYRPEESARVINELLARHRIIDPKTGQIATFNWHSLRHHRGTELALQGFDLLFIQSELGHSTPNMTMAYIGARLKLKKKAIEEKGSGYFINIYGDIVVPRTDADTELKKEQITKTWTNGGRCGLPSQIGEWCEHANACLGCNHYEADSESLDYFQVQEVNLEQTAKKQERTAQDLEEQGRSRLAEIERRRAARNQKALTGCRNIINTIRDKGVYRGESSKYRKAND